MTNRFQYDILPQIVNVSHVQYGCGPSKGHDNDEAHEDDGESESRRGDNFCFDPLSADGSLDLPAGHADLEPLAPDDSGLQYRPHHLDADGPGHFRGTGRHRQGRSQDGVQDPGVKRPRARRIRESGESQNTLIVARFTLKVNLATSIFTQFMLYGVPYNIGIRTINKQNMLVFAPHLML